MEAHRSEKTAKPRGHAERPAAQTSARRGAEILFRAGLVILMASLAFAWISLRHRRGPTPVRPVAAPNVLLISVDTLGADHLGAYGAATPTPTLDRLAEEGVVFEKALSQVPITLPSHASLFTGRYPIAHGVRDNGSFRLAESEVTLAEVFRAAGYLTAAFVGSFALDSRFGLDQGFEVYDDLYGDTSEFDDFAISERNGEAVLARALEWLGDREAKWFVFVHLYDPHSPYAPPPPLAESYRHDPYTGEVVYADRALGGFLSSLADNGKLENTLVIFTSDHGEGLGDHGEKTHGMFAYESTLHVPLLLWWPGVLPPSRRIPARVRLIDVAPTATELAGIPAPEGCQGESLLPFIVDPELAEDRDAYFEALSFNLNRNWAPLTGLYHDAYKLIDLPIGELYDIETDPAESRNLFEERPRLGGEMAGALRSFVRRHGSVAPGGPRRAEVDEETVARLRTLGYVTAPEPPKERGAYTAEDDPKRLVHLADMLDEGVAAQLAGRTEDAIRSFCAILAERPTFAIAYANLAHALHEGGRLEEAIAVLKGAVGRGMETRTMAGRLGAYLQEAGEFERSVTILEAVIRDYPDYAEAYNYLGVSYARLGRVSDSLRTLRELLELDPSYASAHSNMGSVYLQEGSYRVAETSFRRALELDPKLARAWNGLGVVCASTGREEDALSAWRRSLELDSRQYDTLFNLGTLLTKLDRFDEALPYLDEFVRKAPPDRYRTDIPKVKRLVEDLRRRG